MKKPSTEFIIGAIVFALIAIGSFGVCLSLLEQTQKLANLEDKTQLIFDSQIKIYDKVARLIELKTVNRGEIQSWKEKYNTFLNSIKKGIDTLTEVDSENIEAEKKGKKEDKNKDKKKAK